MSDIVINGLVGIISSIIAWLLAKRKYNADVDKSVIDNMQKALDFYTKLSDDNKNRLDENQKQLNEVLNENICLKGELEQLKAQIKFLMQYNCMRFGCSKRITSNPSVEECGSDMN